MFLTFTLLDKDTKESKDVVVFANDEKVNAFSDAYFPLNNSSANIFLESFAKDNRVAFYKASSSSKALAEIVDRELTHALDIAHECG